MIGLILELAGFVLLVVGWWGAIRDIFTESRSMGYLSFLVPIVPLIWTFIHWDELKQECILMLVGQGMIAAGIFFFPTIRAA